MDAEKKVLVLNGPNLNLLGKREPEIYGRATLSDIESKLRAVAADLKVNLDFRQSNMEGQLVEMIHSAMGTRDFIIINPGAYTHTSIAIRDALLGVHVPFIEVHISNVHAREEFRRRSFLSDVAVGVICGFGIDGYEYALRKAVNLLSE
ncbi:MAG: type II 3-dehydroquinate dehydratase [Succinivibrionaceae bacterium]|nr:type II 3-dehydroquinate dehydratase [Succinivibrionaceae bacterium]